MKSILRKRKRTKPAKPVSTSAAPNWTIPCMVCNQLPTVPGTELCGPCCFGEADTAGGNW